MIRCATVTRHVRSSAKLKQDAPHDKAAASVVGFHNRTSPVATEKVHRSTRRHRNSKPVGTRRSAARTAPAFVAPMQSKTIAELPAGGDWVYEVKRGGKRTIAVKNGGRVKLYREDGEPLECPLIADVLRHVPAKAAVIDGEIIYLIPARGDRQLRFFAWDLLHLNGHDMTMRSLEERKHRLCTLTLDSDVLFSPSLGCEPVQLVEEVARLSLDGVVAKRKGSIYEPGKCTGSWLSLPLNRGTNQSAQRPAIAVSAPTNCGRQQATDSPVRGKSGA